MFDLQTYIDRSHTGTFVKEFSMCGVWRQLPNNHLKRDTSNHGFENF